MDEAANASALRHSARIWKERTEGWLIITRSVLQENLDRYFKEGSWIMQLPSSLGLWITH
jgi:hypothetical protein